MIVADCTVIARLILAMDDPAPADALRAHEPEWCSPTLWQAEFANVLRTYERAGRMSAGDCDECSQSALELFAETTQHIPLARVLETSRRTGCSTYDSHYIALAEDLNAKLYTYDEEILKKCPRIARRP